MIKTNQRKVSTFSRGRELAQKYQSICKNKTPEDREQFLLLCKRLEHHRYKGSQKFIFHQGWQAGLSGQKSNKVRKAQFRRQLVLA